VNPITNLEKRKTVQKIDRFLLKAESPKFYIIYQSKK